MVDFSPSWEQLIQEIQHDLIKQKDSLNLKQFGDLCWVLVENEIDMSELISSTSSLLEEGFADNQVSLDDLGPILKVLA